MKKDIKAIPQRLKKYFPDAIWLEEPEEYLYVRESNFFCCCASYKPKKAKYKFGKRKGRVSCKMIGYTKPKHIGNRVFKGVFWWLKGHDMGMPYEQDGYGQFPFCPDEAVRFVKKKKND